jgi:hypothetical protein
MNETDYRALVDRELRHADPRSAPYKAGMVAGLRFKVDGVPPLRDFCFQPGTAEADAFCAGIDHGKALASQLTKSAGGTS